MPSSRPLARPTDRLPRRWYRATAAVLGATLALGSLAACATQTSTTTAAGSSTSAGWGDTSVRTASDADGTVWDSSSVHTISVDVDEEDYAAMLATFLADGDKDWISASVTIDGETFENVGVRLKGNSSLRSVSATESEAQDLPWLIRLDKFVDGQDLDGTTGFVVRSSGTQTSLNEALALELLEAAGLASQEAIATRFSVNGSAESLRLTIEDLDDAWDAQEFGTEGILYKAQADGDYSYRGDDPASYEDVFSQKTGDEDDLTPLIGFLQFINESDDATFAAELDEHLDVEAFATYLAMEDLMDNVDDIDGPGNNSSLRYDTASATFTVVAWDHNLAFGQGPTGGGGAGAPGDAGGAVGADGERPTLPDGVEPGAGFSEELPDGALPDGATPPTGEMPEGMTPPTGQRPGGDATGDADGAAGAGGGMGGGMGGSNVLSSRFLADPTFAALYDEALADLTASLSTSGVAQDILDTWTTLLTDEAGDLVDAATVASESAALSASLTGTGSGTGSAAATDPRSSGGSPDGSTTAPDAT